MNTGDYTARNWTLTGLAIALFAMPVVVGVYHFKQIPLTVTNVLLREIIIFAVGGVLLGIIKYREGLGWKSVGLHRPIISNTALWVLITSIGTALALALAFGLISIFGWSFGSSDSSNFDKLPAWVLLVVITRAGILEELFYRGYAIERLLLLTNNRYLSIALPLILFALFHYRQGPAGITIAFMSGAVMTAVYVYKRNLWITITTHFMVDFIPNIIVPLFGPT